MRDWADRAARAVWVKVGQWPSAQEAETRIAEALREHVPAGASIVRELQLPSIGATCDWGGCNRRAVLERLSRMAMVQWLPVCLRCAVLEAADSELAKAWAKQIAGHENDYKPLLTKEGEADYRAHMAAVDEKLRSVAAIPPITEVDTSAFRGVYWPPIYGKATTTKETGMAMGSDEEKKDAAQLGQLVSNVAGDPNLVDDWATAKAASIWTEPEVADRPMDVALAGQVAKALRAERARMRGFVAALLVGCDGAQCEGRCCNVEHAVARRLLACIDGSVAS